MAETVAAYLRTRLGPGRFAPLAIGLVAASLAGEPWPGAGAMARRLMLAVSLLVAFRVWDDLADRDRDAARHPARVLVTAPTLAPFVALAAGAAAASTALILAGPAPGPRLAVALLLGLGLAAWYGPGRRRWPQPIAGYHVVLAKYPVFVYLLSGGPARPLPRGLAMLLVYLALCVHEVWDDPALATAPGARRALRTETAALLTLALLAAWEIVT